MPLPELKMIDAVRRRALAPGKSGFGAVLKSIGDDCAILRGAAREDLLVTTDFSIEDVHFRREWHPAESVGHRCLARGLSDIAAMGGEPVAAFLSLALPTRLPQSWVDGFFRGFLRLAKRHHVPLAGGDIAESRAGVAADVVLLGRVRHGQAILRSGAKSGDLIYVTGEVGGSAAVLHLFRTGKKMNPGNRAQARHFFPEPRLAAAERLRGLATSMIDVSDGLSSDLAHICAESKVGAVIAARNIPQALGADLELALHGGEDYELLFTASPRTKIPATIARVRVTQIGRITRQPGIWLERGGTREKLKTGGWQHFKGGKR